MTTTRRPGSSTRIRVAEFEPQGVRRREDHLATEEPLQIRLSWPGSPARPMVVTMRTPGADFELAVGFLRSEGMVGSSDDIVRVAYCTDRALDATQEYNVVTVQLAGPPAQVPSERYGAVTAACGVCGKQSLDDLELRGHPTPNAAGPLVAPDLLHTLPDRLRADQSVFDRTGGLHASGLFTAGGELMCVREDVGRHNAVDKVAGWALLQDHPLAESVLVVSGRAGFEIVQKAVAAGIPFVAAVGAPSSLAVDVARRFDVTLVGFLRAHRFVAYSGVHRIRPTPSR